MLTAEKMSQMILEIESMNNIGCTFDFKERYDVALPTLNALSLVTSIRSKIPACGDHCSRYQDCQWIPIFQKKKSKSKFKLSKTGEKLAADLANRSQSKEEIKDIILGVISKTIIVDVIQSLLMEHTNLTVERVVTEMLKQTKIYLQTIRTVLKDILDLMASLELIKFKEGLILSYV
ncbi:MAG: hypothetical protein FK733_06685 [Asgard group archaeon]|nr:hypothetical protein [Asgard group archaeon]